ncbi:MAG: GNAT family N-acetyltransferase [Candidatus Thermoplasmatota archaeon]|nr:GNAT family N-acetyltransferase [Candidatus Thermoplasmatota archaeon]
MFELGRIRFRPFRKEDLSFLEDWENTREVTLYARGRPLVFKNREDIEGEFEEYQENDDKHRFILEIREHDKIIGIATYKEEINTVKNADVGTYIGEKDYWNQGIGKEITLGLCEILFYHKNFDRVSAWSSSFNKRSHKVIKSVGFKKSGRARKSGYLFGKRVDWLMFDLLREEYMNSRESLLDEILAEKKEEYTLSQCRIKRNKEDSKEE